MTLPTDTPPGEGWRDQPGLLRAVVGLDDDEVSRRYLERWSYLRSRRDLLQVLRVRDFGSVSSGHALLEHLQRTSGSITVALHVEVVETSKAQGLAARAVHRLGSDSAATRAAGFRRTAQSARAMDRVVQREELVAGGEAMLRLALYMVVSAASLDQLRVATRELTARAERSGHRVELGHGRQALWFSAALPGGPGW